MAVHQSVQKGPPPLYKPLHLSHRKNQFDLLIPYSLPITTANCIIPRVFLGETKTSLYFHTSMMCGEKAFVEVTEILLSPGRN